MEKKVFLVALVLMCVTVGMCWADTSSSESEQSELVASTQWVQSLPNPTTAEEMLEMGNAYEAEKDYSNALLWFNKVVSQYPDKALEANFCIGWSYQEQGMYAEAIAAYNTTISFTPADTRKDKFCSKQARYNLGDCYRESENWDAAIAIYTQLVKDDPSDEGSLMLSLGHCYQGKKNYEKAMAIYNQVSVEHPNKAEDVANCKFDLADCYVAEENFATALAIYSDLSSESSPPGVALRAWFCIGWYYQSFCQGKYTEAIDAYKSALNSVPTGTTKDDFFVKYTKYHLAECYRDNGEWDNAIARYLDLVADYPDWQDDCLSSLEYCYKTSGKKPGGIGVQVTE